MCLDRLNTTWITISFVAALITAFTVQVSPSASSGGTDATWAQNLVSSPAIISAAALEIQSAYTIVMFLSFVFTLMSTVSCVILLCLNVFATSSLEKLQYLRAVGAWADFPSVTFVIGALFMAADVVLTIQVVRSPRRGSGPHAYQCVAGE